MSSLSSLSRTPGRALVSTTFVATLATAGSLLVAAPAEARPWPGHPDRNLVTHTVRAGDTPSGLSVRYHAWTREFIALNGSVIRIGERVTVPVVVSAARKDRGAQARKRAHHPQQDRQAQKTQKVRKAQKATRATRPRRGGWQHTDMSRAEVGRLIAHHARRRGVPVRLAQAVAWQESGWRQRLVSSAGAIGVMQVLPSTGVWMSGIAGERIPLRNTHGNVRAGTMLLRLLLDHTTNQRSAVAAYYEGLRGIQNGWYDETKQYVRNVMAIRRQLGRSGSPRG